VTSPKPTMSSLLNELQQRSQDLLALPDDQTITMELSVYEDILASWHQLLHNDNISTEPILPSTAFTINALFTRWFDLAVQRRHRFQSEPFQNTLESLVKVVTMYHQKSLYSPPSHNSLPTSSGIAHAAMQLLNHWRTLLDGDLAHCPTRAGYEQVLVAFAKDLSSRESIRIAADVAHEITYLLTEWSFTMKPTARTWHCASACLARTLLHLYPQHSHPHVRNDNNNNSTETKEEHSPTAQASEEVETSRKKWQQQWLTFTESTCQFRVPPSSPDSLDVWMSTSYLLQCVVALDLVSTESLGDHGVQEEESLLQRQPKTTIKVKKNLESLLNLFVDHFPTGERSAKHSQNHRVELILLHSFLTAVQQILLHKDDNAHIILEPQFKCKIAMNSLDLVEKYMKAVSKSNSGNVCCPNVMHYTGAIRILSQNSHEKDGYEERLQNYLSSLLQLLDTDGNGIPSDFGPEQGHVWNCILDACWMVGAYDDGVSMWKRMKSLRVYRDGRSMSLILKILAAQSFTSPTAATMAHSIWQKGYIQTPPHRRNFVPTAEHSASVMVAWSRGRHPDAARQCQAIFDNLVQENDPNVQLSAIHYTSLIVAYGKSPQKRYPDASERILQLYRDMQRDYIELTPQAHVSILAALARRNNLQSAQEAESILNQLEDSWLASRRTSSIAPPDIRCYSFAMSAWVWANAPDAVEKCEAILQRLEHIWEQYDQHPDWLPSNYVYRALMEAWLKSNRPDSAKQTEALLNLMEQKAAYGRAEFPNKVVYTIVLQNLLKVTAPNSPERAQALIDRMREAYAAGNLASKPDTQTMSTVMQIIARSKDLRKAQKCGTIFFDMCTAYEERGDVDVRPNAFVLNALLNACVFTDKHRPDIRKEAVQVALTALHRLEELELTDCLNSHTYSYLFRVLGNHIESAKERTQLAEILFQRK
jgi:hypothetical protein